LTVCQQRFASNVFLTFFFYFFNEKRVLRWDFTSKTLLLAYSQTLLCWWMDDWLYPCDLSIAFCIKRFLTYFISLTKSAFYVGTSLLRMPIARRYYVGGLVACYGGLINECGSE